MPILLRWETGFGMAMESGSFFNCLFSRDARLGGEGSHWIEEGEIDVETAPGARDSDDEQLDTGDVLS